MTKIIEREYRTDLATQEVIRRDWPNVHYAIVVLRDDQLERIAEAVVRKLRTVE